MKLSGQKILKILVSGIAGLIAGATLGFVLGGTLGGVLSLFSNELSKPSTVRIVGLVLGASVGAIIGSMVISLGNKVLNNDEKTSVGILIGTALGAFTGFTNWDANAATQIGFATMLFAGSVGISGGAFSGLASAIFIAARAPEGNTVASSGDKQKDDEFASFMKQRLNK